MSLSKHLQTSGLLQTVGDMSAQSLRQTVIELGNDWYRENPHEREIIARNLTRFGLDASPEAVDRTVRGTLLHYFEKFLPLVGTVSEYRDFLDEHIDSAEAVSTIRESTGSRRGACIATAHYGAVEFMVPVLAAAMLPVNTVLKFQTEAFSSVAQQRAESMERSGKFSLIRLIEIGKPKTVAAMQMAAALRRQEIVLSVFDERTPYSKPVSLFGTRVWGGAGLDRMLSFTNSPSDLFAAFMIRSEAGRYRLELRKIDEGEPDAVAAIYAMLENVVKRDPGQWYFLHEEIPFVECEEKKP